MLELFNLGDDPRPGALGVAGCRKRDGMLNALSLEAVLLQDEVALFQWRPGLLQPVDDLMARMTERNQVIFGLTAQTRIRRVMDMPHYVLGATVPARRTAWRVEVLTPALLPLWTADVDLPFPVSLAHDMEP